MINNTIVRNRSTGTGTNSQGAGIHAYWGSAVTGRNNIVYDNTATSSPNAYGPVSLTYSCVEGGLSGTGNISANPLFVHRPPQAYFLLSQAAAGQVQNSHCVDAGDPTSPLLSGTTRTDGVPDAGIVDMGYHWDLPASLPDHLNSILSTDNPEEEILKSERCHREYKLNSDIHPNPFNPTTTISFTLPNAMQVNLSIYNISGRLVETLVNGWRDAGTHEVTFDGSNLASGVYIYCLQAGEYSSSGKMVLMK